MNKLKWIEVGEREEVCRYGLVRFTSGGNGRVCGMLRRPFLLNDVPYNRITIEKKPKAMKVEDIILAAGLTPCVVIDEYWTKLAQRVTFLHNLTVHLAYKKNPPKRKHKPRTPKVVQEDVIIEDIFSNDNWLY